VYNITIAELLEKALALDLANQPTQACEKFLEYMLHEEEGEDPVDILTRWRCFEQALKEIEGMYISDVSVWVSFWERLLCCQAKLTTY
jgi:hypothetical protein